MSPKLDRRTKFPKSQRTELAKLDDVASKTLRKTNRLDKNNSTYANEDCTIITEILNEVNGGVDKNNLPLMATDQITRTKLEDTADADERYKMIHDAVRIGFQEYKTTYKAWTKDPKCEYIRDFKPHWNTLATKGKLIMLNDKIFIPELCRQAVLNAIHQGHQGVVERFKRQGESCIGRTSQWMLRRCVGAVMNAMHRA